MNRLSVLALIVLLPALPAQAVDFCVSSNSQLAGALSLAETGLAHDGLVRIQLVQGNYSWTRAQDVRSRLEVLGGYTSGCSTRVIDAMNTTIAVGGGLRKITSCGPGILLEGVRWQVSAQVLNVGSGGFAGSSCWDQGNTVRVRRNRFEILAGADNLSLQTYNTGMDFHDNLVLGPGASGRVWVRAESNDGRYELRFVNNTLRGLWDGLVLLTFGNDVHLKAEVHSNIIWHAAAAASGLVRDPSSIGSMTVLARNNTWRNNDVPLFPGSGNNSTADPWLNDSHVPADASPAVNSGNNSPPGGLAAFDLVGRPRKIGSAVDRGAFETLVDDAPQLVVTTINDSGAGSLRQAIITANTSPTPTRIRFAIPGTPPRILIAGSPYPDIITPIEIDATSQTGSVENSLEYGNNAEYAVWIAGGGAPSHAFRVAEGAPAGASLELRGVAVGGFGTAVVLNGGSGHRITGNHFGTGVGGLLANGDNLLIGGDAANAFVGGFQPQQRNTISSAGNHGIRINPSAGGHWVINNYIGTSRSGGEANGNARGIRLADNGAFVVNNLISANTVTGVLVTGDENFIGNNRIGTKVFDFCFTPGGCDPNAAGYRLGNGTGMQLSAGASGNTISGNTIAHSTSTAAPGRGLVFGDDAGQGNRVAGNAIYNNGELDFDQWPPQGPNPIRNEAAGCQPAGTQCRSNFPELFDAIGQDFNQGVVRGRLRATNGVRRIEVFSSWACGPSGYGPGHRLIGAQNVTVSGAVLFPPANGSVEFAIPVESPQTLIGRYITATAIRQSDGTTSEFSACVPFRCDRIYGHGFDGASAWFACAPP